ncbi:MAG TPA: GNAT family N-acetyltransferase [Blastocatellia bacterium]
MPCSTVGHGQAGPGCLLASGYGKRRPEAKAVLDEIGSGWVVFDILDDRHHLWFRIIDMTTLDDPALVNVEVFPAPPEQEPVLANLLQLYIHDFSELINVRLGPDGRYAYENLPLYWREPTRHPFVITADGDLAGFALVQKGSQISGDPNVWDMAEFFVVRAYRRRGAGTKAANRLWQLHPGKWEVRVINLNEKAVEFWAHAIREFVGHPVVPTQFEAGGFDRHVFSFESQ